MTKKDIYFPNGVLKNKKHILDPLSLYFAKIDVSGVATYRLSKVPAERIITDWNKNDLLSIHRDLFSNLYEWAGTTRELPLLRREKALNNTIKEYPYPEFVNTLLDDVFLDIEKTDWRKLDRNGKIDKFCDIFSKLYDISPFYDGNMQAIGLYMEKLVQRENVLIDVFGLTATTYDLHNRLVKYATNNPENKMYLKSAVSKHCYESKYSFYDEDSDEDLELG